MVTRGWELPLSGRAQKALERVSGEGQYHSHQQMTNKMIDYIMVSHTVFQTKISVTKLGSQKEGYQRRWELSD